MASLGAGDLTVEPDLQPLYPTPADISHLLSPNVGLAPFQKAELVSHCLTRACTFGDLGLLSFLLTNPQAQNFVDLGKQDEDGLGLISIMILGFGSESDREIEREECVRLLVAEGADVNVADNAGWTALHYASLMSPPTLVSHLLTHGCSPLSLTKRHLSALDIVTAHSTVPGREDVALLLEEAMREGGWKGGRMEERRHLLEKRVQRSGILKRIQEDIEKELGIDSAWWGEDDVDLFDEISDDEDEEDLGEDHVLTPPPDYTSMLVFSPIALPDIFQSLIIDFRPTLRNAEPANALYMLARFACLNCDDDWLEDLIIGATDAIEDTVFNRSEDTTCLVFWLYNTTIWLHLMRCDDAINQTCEELGSFSLIEEILNSVFVFIIRFAERKIDHMIDACLLDYSPLSTEFGSVQFESEWSFLRTFAGKKKAANNVPATINVLRSMPPSPNPQTRPPSPLASPPATSPSSTRGFASFRQSLTRTRASSTAAPINHLFNSEPAGPSPKDITTFMTALHKLLTLAGINPALITQFWSQVMYWSACETFNRILTRKKYLCRTRAVQIGMNISVLEEWIGNMELPRGIGSHFASVRDLLNWLQCLSSITEFPNLIATIQTMRHLNPLQMRRAVRDYKYEVNEGRMTEECSQYLAQLQKDWERHRVKLGVELLRKEIVERDRDRDESDTQSNDMSPPSDSDPLSAAQESTIAQRSIDMLFDRSQEKSIWEPVKAPEPLGELLDSRNMLPLFLPSDPRMLGAQPPRRSIEAGKRSSYHLGLDSSGRSASRASHGSRGALAWRLNSHRLRDVGVSTLQWVDGERSASRWTRPVDPEPEPDEEEGEIPPPYSSDDPNPAYGDLKVGPSHLAPLTRKPSTRSRGKASMGDSMTPIDRSDNPGDLFAG